LDDDDEEEEDDEAATTGRRCRRLRLFKEPRSGFNDADVDADEVEEEVEDEDDAALLHGSCGRVARSTDHPLGAMMEYACGGLIVNL